MHGYPPVFIRWSMSHWGALICVTLCATFLIVIARRLPEQKRFLIGRLLAVIFLLTFLIETFIRILRDHWEPWQDRLPLHFCSLMTLVCFDALWHRSRWSCSLAYFGVLTASVQGLITPMLWDGFPSASFFAFFVGHGLLLVSALYIPLGIGWRARPWDDLRTLLYANIYLLAIIPINLLLDTNYGFTQQAPKGSILEYFGPEPWCLFLIQPLAWLILRLLYFPVRAPKPSSPSVAIGS